MSGEVIYSSGTVSVTRTLVQIGGMSYPVNGIVTVFVKKPENMKFYVFGGILAAVGLIGLAVSRTGAFGIFWIMLGAALVWLGYTRPHALILRTAAGNQQALSSRDTRLLFDVKQAIESAVSTRG